METVVFECESKQIADYLVEHGSKLIDVDRYDGKTVYVFVHDDTIEENLDAWESNFAKSMF